MERDPSQAAAYCGAPALQAPPDGLAARLDAALTDAIERGAGGEHVDSIRNTDRSIGPRLSGLVARETRAFLEGARESDGSASRQR